MRKNFLFLITILLIAVSLYAQIPPEKMSYQIVVRDNNNELVVNKPIGMQISILKGFPGGNSVYTETHSTTTNANALASVQVGTGTPTPGSDFSAIDWGGDDYYLKSEIDLTGGTNYTITGTQQLITVPYAFHSGTTAYVDYNMISNRPVGSNDGDLLYWNVSDSSWHILPIGQQGQVLTSNNGALTWISNPAMQNSIPPTVVTDTVYNITGRTAEVVCHIVNPGSTGVIASGVCWSTHSNPSLGNSYTTDGTSIDTFISAVSNLTSGTTFYVRAYATNSVGTSYGQPIKFTTPVDCGTVTDYDGNIYQTIYIGAQCWMKENLKTKHYSNGDAMTEGTKGNTLYSGTRYWFRYGDDVQNENTYGLLYSWDAVMNGAGSSNNNPSGIQGICPSGWHVPSNSEWCELENFVEPGIDVNCATLSSRGSMAKKLSLPSYWDSYQGNSFAPGYWSYNVAGFNTTSFSVIPGGYYYHYYSYYPGTNDTYYTGLGSYATFWSCTNSMSDNEYAYYRLFSYSSSGVEMATTYKNSNTSSSHAFRAMSVRCVKN